VFKAEFLIATSTFARAPWLALIFGLGLVIAFGALIIRLQGVLFGKASEAEVISTSALFPLYAHLAIVLAAGIYLPQSITRWFEAVAKMLG
jgi:hydrogenase-4 component F